VKTVNEEHNSTILPDLWAIRSLRVGGRVESTSNLTVPFSTASVHIYSHCCNTGKVTNITANRMSSMLCLYCKS